MVAIGARHLIASMPEGWRTCRARATVLLASNTRRLSSGAARLKPFAAATNCYFSKLAIHHWELPSASSPVASGERILAFRRVCAALALLIVVFTSCGSYAFTDGDAAAGAFAIANRRLWPGLYYTARARRAPPAQAMPWAATFKVSTMSAACAALSVDMPSLRTPRLRLRPQISEHAERGERAELLTSSAARNA